MDRIDTFELIAVIILCIGGEFEEFITNIIFIFGFENGQTVDNETITTYEFHFFLDCLFRGIMAMVVPPEQVKNKVESHRYQLK